MTKREESRLLNFDYSNELEENSIEIEEPFKPGVYYPKSKSSHHRRGSRTQNKRFVFKNGDLNIDQPQSLHRSYCSKWFITMIVAPWRWNLFHFFMAFTIEWLFFAFIYWTIALIHGDLTEEHLPSNPNATNWVPCVKNIYGFTSTFLFSVEVHTTVAYGKRSITLECPQMITAMCFQCIISQFFQAIMVGVLFAKLTRPKLRTQTILFSRQAVVTVRDGKLCMIFRVGDMRKSRILNIKASVYLLKLNLNDVDDFEQVEMEVEMDGCESTFFLWPVSIIHVIDSKSPLYGVSAADLLLGEIEILAVFEGIIESTGQPVQARTSYTGSDILWGHRFLPIVKVNCETKMYNVDYSKLSETKKFETHLCSASELNSKISM